MKVLVTGGAGFIGSHCVDLLVENNHEVIVVDNLDSGKSEYINKKAKFYLADIRDKVIRKIFAIEQPDVVVHFAAQTSVPKSVEDPMLDADVNIKGLLNLLDSSISNKVCKFVFISTGGAIYGDATQIPTNEDYLPEMITPYALTKYTSEKYLSVYNKLYGLKFTVLRLSNVYGPRQTPKGESGVVPIFIDNIIERKASKLFAYSDMENGGSRDYIYVKDVAKACELALTKGDNRIFNIGTGREIYMLDLYSIINKIAGTDVTLIKESERKGDVRRSVLDCKRAKEELSWCPSVCLEDGLKWTYEYCSEKSDYLLKE